MEEGVGGGGGKFPRWSARPGHGICSAVEFVASGG